MLLKKKIFVVIDLEFATTFLSYNINNLLSSIKNTKTREDYFKDERNELIILIKNSIIHALLGFNKPNKNDNDTYNDAIHQAIDSISYYGIPLEIAAELINKTESLMLSSIIDYFPNIDDRTLVEIIDYKLLPDGNILLTLELNI